MLGESHSVTRSVATAAGLAAVLGTVIVLATVGAAGVATTEALAQSTNETNITVHEDPETVGERGDLDRVGGWLNTRLADRLRENSLRLSEDQYEAADRLLGDDFQRRLGQYAHVAGETGGVSEETPQAFERARNRQRNLTSTAREFDDTYEDYQEARDRRDTAATRRHARQLTRLAQEAGQQGTGARRALGTIENETGTDTSNIRRRVRNVTRELEETAEEVRVETFVDTRLSVRTNRSVASFTSPAELRGRLRLANGTAVTNRTIRLRIGPSTHRTTTAPDGTFRVTYRPVLIAANATTVPVRYVPRSTAQYNGSGTRLSLRVRQVEPALRTTVAPDRVGYRDAFSADAVLVANGTAVPDVPVVTTLAGQPVGEATTDDRGRAVTGTSLDATVPPGDVTVRTTLGVSGRAIAPVTATTTLAVRETSTALTVDASPDGNTVVVTGRLTAGDDGAKPVPSQDIVVDLGGTARTVRTDSEGRYRATVTRSALSGVAADESAGVRARFDGAGTNLESAAANASVVLPAGSDGGASGDGPIVELVEAAQESVPLVERIEAAQESVPLAVWVGLGVLGLLLAAGYGWGRWGPAESPPWLANLGEPVGAVLARVRAWRRADAETTPATTGGGEESSPAPTEPAEGAEAADEGPLATARDALAAGDSEGAVVAAYGAVRASLGDRFDVGEGRTVRELLAACEDRLDADAYATLETLTDAYERTVFAPGEVEQAGQRAVEAAQTLLEPGPTDSGEPADD